MYVCIGNQSYTKVSMNARSIMNTFTFNFDVLIHATVVYDLFFRLVLTFHRKFCEMATTYRIKTVIFQKEL